MPWWGWLLVGLGLLAVLVVAAVAFRSQLSFAVKFARILMADRRVPRPLRWLIGISLAIKVVPFPDFGLDEVVLIIVGLVLLIFYRPVLRSILEETRSRQSDRSGAPPGPTPQTEHPAT
jgi:membrane protein implicated in regulation of membrane protease activity